MIIKTICIVCPVLCTSIGGGSRQRRRITPSDTGNDIINLIQNTEIGAPLRIISSRSDPFADTATEKCNSPSVIWMREQVNKVPDDDDVSNFFNWHVHSLPFSYKLYVERRSLFDQEYFGIDGQYTHEINNIHEQAQDFWSDTGVDDDIELLCAHGYDLADSDDKLIPTLEVMFGSQYNDQYTIQDHANDIQDLITRLPNSYDFPLLTYNAFATDAKNDRPSSIIIGDGYFEFQQSVGLESEGPEYAVTHEHAHHLQFLLNDINDYTPEDDEEYTTTPASQKTRREELMADAFSAYFLAHDSGGRMSSKEISNIHTISYSVGDCALLNDDHHGTPSQRQCATRWGASLSQDEDDIDLIELQDRFEVWYKRVDGMNDLCQYEVSSVAVSLITRGRRIMYSLQVIIVLFGSISIW